MGVRRPRGAARFGRVMLRVRLVCLAACASALFLAGAATEAAAQPVVTAVRVAEPPAILEYNSFDATLDGNLLLTYRVNSGTVFYLGYDGHYQQEDRLDRLDPMRFLTPRYRRTNRAIFTKVSYLFRY